MTTYVQLKKQIEKLQKEAEVILKRDRAKTISNIKTAIAAFGLTVDDLGFSTTVRESRNPKKFINSKQHGHRAKKLVNESQERKLAIGKKSILKLGDNDKRSIVAPKYRDAATGATWTGRGKQPNWLSAAVKGGKRLEDFKI